MKLRQPKPYAFLSERWIRNARMAGYVFGSSPGSHDWYRESDGKAAWYAYWQHARISRALRYIHFRKPLLWSPYFQTVDRIVGAGTPISYRKRPFSHPGIKGHNGVCSAEEKHSIWQFRYFSMLKALEHLGKPYDRKLMPEFRIKVMKEPPEYVL